MRVALFTDSFLPQVNGVTRVLEEQLKYFEKHDIEYIVFAPQYDGYDDSRFKGKIERFKSVSFVFYKECRMSVPNYFRMKKLLKNFRPNVIHIVTPFVMGIEGLRCAKQLGIPTIAIYHTNYAQYMKYYYVGFIKTGLWEYLRWFHNQCQLSLCPSYETKKEMLKHGIYNVEVCPNGVDPKIFDPANRDDRIKEKYNMQGKVNLLYVGRISREKNLDMLADVMKILNARTNIPVQMIMAGDGPYIEHMKRVMPPNTIFTGYLFGNDLAKLYASSDIFVFPSVTETFGNVVVEAMASGLPVVGISAGGVKDNIESGYNGFIVPPGDVDQFASALLMLIGDQASRKRMGHNARQFSLGLAWDVVNENLVQFYEYVSKLQEDGTMELA